MTDITYFCRPATETETATTVNALRAHTESCISVPVEHEPFAVTAYHKGTLAGSIIGKIYSNWMHLDLVWVAETQRGKGIGRGLLQQAIAEGQKHSLTGIEVWTQSWQAPEFYIACGFTELAVIDDFLPGQKRHALRYQLGEKS